MLTYHEQNALNCIYKKLLFLCGKINDLEDEIADILIVGDGTGILSLNLQLGNAQTLVTGTAGINFTINSAGDVHTFNIPNSSALNRGLLIAADWTTFNNKMANPMTTLGDIIYGGALGVPTRRAIGSNGQILGVSGGLPVWGAASTFFPTIYSGDGSLAGPRTVTGGGNALTFTGLGFTQFSTNVNMEFDNTNATGGFSFVNTNWGDITFGYSVLGSEIYSGAALQFSSYGGNLTFASAANQIIFNGNGGVFLGDILVNNAPASIIVSDGTTNGNLGFITPANLGALGNTPLVRTVAQMQTLASGSALIPGQLYQITDADSSRAVLNIRAYSTTQLEKRGEGTYINAAMILPVNCTIWYDLTTDTIRRIIEPINNNDVSEVSNISIQYISFDNSLYTFTNNILIDCDLSGGFTPIAFNRNYFQSSIITLSGTTFLDNIGTKTSVTDIVGVVNNTSFGQASVTVLGGINASTLSACIIENSATVTLPDGVVFTGCIIGINKVVDTTSFGTNYTQTNSILGGEISTFSVSDADGVVVSPDGFEAINMVNYDFAGILKITNDTNALNVIANFPSDHKVRILADPSKILTVKDLAIAAGNIQLEVAGSTLLVNGNNDDYLEFTYGLNHADGTIIKIGGVIRS